MERILNYLLSGNLEKPIGTEISEAEIVELCAKAKEILIEEPNVKRLDAPITVR